MRFYTREDLKKQRKVSCRECIYLRENEACGLAPSIIIEPDNSFYDIDGNILGCIHGSRKNERME